MQTDLNVHEGFRILRRVALTVGVFAMVFSVLVPCSRR